MKEADGEDVARMANNAKGRAELQGLKAFANLASISVTIMATTSKWALSCNDIETDIELYERPELDDKARKVYGLEESRYDLWRGHTKEEASEAPYPPGQQASDDASICNFQGTCRSLMAIWRRVRGVPRAHHVAWPYMTFGNPSSAQDSPNQATQT